jgi:hypothetical protein
LRIAAVWTQAIGTLEEILMNNNGMYEADIVKLAEAFAANKSLKVRRAVL